MSTGVAALLDERASPSYIGWLKGRICCICLNNRLANASAQLEQVCLLR